MSIVPCATIASPILAENFDFLWIWVVGPPVVLFVAAGLSLFGAARGHWSGPAVSVPVVGLAGLCFLALAMARAPFLLLLLSLCPLAVGIVSISLWAQRRST
jgi:hypothetical protein